MIFYTIIGKGKTGKQVIKLLPKNRIKNVFDAHNSLDVKKLKKTTVCIIFIPAVSLTPIIKPIIESQIPVVCGTTGYKWDTTTKLLIKKYNSKWVISNNFSTIMSLLSKIIRVISTNTEALLSYQFLIKEIHHIYKKDSPSGTAISWKNWLKPIKCSIKSIRKKNIIGLHTITIKNKYESLVIKHSSTNRKLFARGALIAANKLIKIKDFMLSSNLSTLKKRDE